MHLVAFWQVFFEELIDYAFARIEPTTNDRYRKIAATAIAEAKARFNTPSTENIDRLIERSLFIPKISHSWHWGAVTRNDACRTVHEVLMIRHEIAHTGKTKRLLSYQTNYKHMEILYRVAQQTEAEVMKQIEANLES